MGIITLFSSFFKKSETAFGLLMIMLMSLLMVPVPGFLIDFLFSLSIALSILVFFTSIFVERPLDFTSFPTLLLVLTLFRLGLNVASTRLILGHGHEGSRAAGKVIEAFGHLIMSGNFVIGFIIFAILVIINFVVITKGSGRIAEVSARFSLDSMPGKQMAIDAELSSGIINDTQAKKKRKELEAESSFYGSMDGAAKFVRGDAIAGLLITFINAIGGIIIGVVQKGLPIEQAFKFYTLLTVGDGLVAQIPALIVSTAAGLIVTKASGDERTDRIFLRQMGSHPLSFMLCAFITGLMSISPGLPFLPFIFLSIASAFWAYHLFQKKEEDEKTRLKEEEDTLVKPTQSDASSAFLQSAMQKDSSMDIIRLEFGQNITSLIPKLTEQIKTLRHQFYKDFGLKLPGIRLQDRFYFDSSSYHVFIKEIDIAKGDVRVNHLLAMNPKGQEIPLEGERVKEPTFGLDAMWIPLLLKKEAQELGLTIVDPATVMMTHISEILKENIGDFVTFSYTQELLDGLNESYKRLLNEIVPTQLSTTQIQRILQSLVSERVSIRDIPTILEGIAQSCSYTRHLPLIIEHVRTLLARQISFSQKSADGYLNVVSLTPEVENELNGYIVGEGDNRQLIIPPTAAHSLIQRILNTVDRLSMEYDPIVLAVAPFYRANIRVLIEKTRSSLMVLSYQEIHPKIKIRNIASV